MEAEVTAAVIAGAVSIIGISLNIWWTHRKLDRELSARREEWQTMLRAQEEQWQESFRAELRRDLTRESALDIVQERLERYGDVWEALKMVAGYHIEHAQDLNADIQAMAHKLTHFAYSETGLVMTDRSRRLLNHLRSGCGGFLEDEIDIQEVRNRAHLLKHSMRADVGVRNLEYDSEIESIAQGLGRVDDWTPATSEEVHNETTY